MVSECYRFIFYKYTQYAQLINTQNVLYVIKHSESSANTENYKKNRCKNWNEGNNVKNWRNELI